MMRHWKSCSLIAAMALLSLQELQAASGAVREVEDVLEKGGVVLWIIVGLSVVGVAIAMERLLATRTGQLLPRRLTQVIEGPREDCSEIESTVKGQDKPLARVIAAGLERRASGRAAMERAMEVRGELELARLSRPIRPLGVLAQVEPLLGLLGTVFGMIGTFAVLKDTSAAERVAKLAPGIGQALYTTAAGLTAAVPFVLLQHFLQGRVQRAAEEWSLLGAMVLERAFPGEESEDQL